MNNWHWSYKTLNITSQRSTFQLLQNRTKMLPSPCYLLVSDSHAACDSSYQWPFTCKMAKPAHKMLHKTAGTYKAFCWESGLKTGLLKLWQDLVFIANQHLWYVWYVQMLRWSLSVSFIELKIIWELLNFRFWDSIFLMTMNPGLICSWIKKIIADHL